MVTVIAFFIGMFFGSMATIVVALCMTRKDEDERNAGRNESE